MKWYQNTTFYEIYVPAFCDGNGDGIGDLIGAALKIPYLKQLGVGGVWLTPFYPSPRADNGYDISDYRNVDSTFGTLEDFDCFLKKAHEAGIKVILDMVLNHTSNKHAWFEESRKSVSNPYRDYYIWEKEIPNNWQSFFDGSAWEYDHMTEMYYYHGFAREQVCLNWSCDKVRQECHEILRFWLERGVDGFRMDVINFLKTDRQQLYQNNPVCNGEIEHRYDKNQPGVYEAIKGISQVVHSYPDKYLLGEVGDDDLQVIDSYVGEGMLDSAFYFNLGSMEQLDIKYMVEQVRRMEEACIYPTLFFSSHDMRRHFNRLCNQNLDIAKLLALFMLTAKGIPFLYQGEEIPMEDAVIEKLEDLQDIQGRYGYEKKIQEGLGEEEAFAYARKRSRDYSRGMVDWKRLDGAEQQKKLFKVYQDLLQIRKEHPALQYGAYEKLEQQGERVYYARSCGKERLGIYLHFDLTEISVWQEKIIYEIEDKKGTLIGLIAYE